MHKSERYPRDFFYTTSMQSTYRVYSDFIIYGNQLIIKWILKLSTENKMLTITTIYIYKLIIIKQIRAFYRQKTHSKIPKTGTPNTLVI